MKALVFILFCVFALPTYAEQIVTVINVEDYYVRQVEPIIVEKCYTENVPVYRNNNSGSEITGAIIGGLIGNQFGSGKGKDAMTVLGAIAGANSQHRSREFAGYTYANSCYQEKTYTETYVHSGYVVTYLINGRYEQVISERRYKKGQHIKINR